MNKKPGFRRNRLMEKNKWAGFYSPLSLEDHLYNLSRHRFFLGKIVAKNPRHLIEVGAGSGSLSIFLSTLGLNVVTVDKNYEVLMGSRQNCLRFKGKVDFVLADGLRPLPFKDIFDVSFSQGVAEHFNDEQCRLYVDNQLQISRTVILSVPNRSYWQSFGDEHLMTPKQWGKILSIFNVKGIKNYGVEIPGRSYLRHKLIRLQIIDIVRPHHISIQVFPHIFFDS